MRNLTIYNGKQETSRERTLLVRIKSLEQTLEEYKQKNLFLSNDLQTLENKLSTSESKLTQIEERSSFTQAHLTQEAQHLNIALTEKENLISQLESSHLKQENEWKFELESLRQENEFLKSNSQSLNYEIESLHQEIGEQITTINSLSVLIEDWENSHSILTTENYSLKLQLTELETKNQVLFNDLDKELQDNARKYAERTSSLLISSPVSKSETPAPRISRPASLSRNRYELTESNQIGLEKAATRLMNSRNYQSPLNRMRISSPSRISNYRLNLIYKQDTPKTPGPSRIGIRERVSELLRNQ